MAGSARAPTGSVGSHPSSGLPWPRNTTNLTGTAERTVVFGFDAQHQPESPPPATGHILLTWLTSPAGWRSPPWQLGIANCGRHPPNTNTVIVDVGRVRRRDSWTAVDSPSRRGCCGATQSRWSRSRAHRRSSTPPTRRCLNTSVGLGRRHLDPVFRCRASRLFWSRPDPCWWLRRLENSNLPGYAGVLGRWWPAAAPRGWKHPRRRRIRPRAGTPRPCARTGIWFTRISLRWQRILLTVASPPCRNRARRAAAPVAC